MPPTAVGTEITRIGEPIRTSAGEFYGLSSSQLVVNPGAEAGDTRGWTKTTVAAGEVFISVDATTLVPVRTNYSGVRVFSMAKGVAGSDIIVRSDAFVSCRPGQTVQVTGSFLPHFLGGPPLEVYLGVFWYDANGDPLNTAAFSAGEASEALALTAAVASGTWTRFTGAFVAPDTAAFFRLRIRLGGAGFAMTALADSLGAFIGLGV